MLYSSLSGELKYFAIFLSDFKVLPPNPNTFPAIECIGNMTLPLKKSKALPSFVLVSPVFTKYSNLYPFAIAASVNAFDWFKQYPKSNFSIISFLNPRSKKYDKPMALPSSVSNKFLLK